ncbi:MAG: ABC transporter ATP-binding protein [Candidatus Krumholzibacteria bacterium]|jgi:ABC-type multidrug transport system fused ATPase/permease subunit|nr:ABC transporter ATP-binding protein [Candidatus Krumholzibacteria bacterium]MDP6669597.1 ABC transporter ATP-binding protein [Candidatus Krumholzibacteria bacterium]MDP6798151.1 ABC transporter ATP-binding protein [Candidatus Krumholzibacteria bacterium]MDP7022002.1 ABC transporter ATP-binding protein [Candidatus Krumholzibacteria bacterium]
MIRFVLSWLLPYWKQVRGLMAGLFALTTLGILTRTLYPVIFKFIIDALTEDFNIEVARNWVLALLGLGLLRELTQAVLPSTRAWLNFTNSLNVRMKHAATILRKPQGFYMKYPAGDLVTRLTDDIDQFEKIGWYSGSGIFRPIEAILTLVFSLSIMFALDWRLSLASALPLPIIVRLLAKTEGMQQKRYAERQKATSETVEQLESSFSGSRIILGFGMEQAQSTLLDRVLLRRKQAEKRVISLQAILEGIFSLMNQAGLIVVLFLGGYFVVKDPEFTLGDFYAFVAYLSGLTMPLWTISWFFVSTNVTKTSIERLLEVEKEKESPRGERSLRDRHPVLHLSDLRFRHQKDTKLLEGISLDLRPGETVALVGSVGCGKTTLLECAMGIQEADSGTVKLADLPLRELNDDSRARHLAYAPQEPRLFTGTVRENVRFGREFLTEDSLERAMATASIEGELSPERKLQQGGSDLSGGQRGRVSLARALAGDPKVLVLDDVTSALDAATERRFWDRMRPLIPDAAVLVSTHRDATAKRADRVLWIEDGVILHEGRHEDLLRDHRGYQELFAMDAEA